MPPKSSESKDFVDALCEALSFILRGQGNASLWLQMNPTDACRGAWRYATWIMLRYGTSSGMRDVHSAYFLERILVKALELEGSKRNEKLVELSELAAVSVNKGAKNPVQLLFKNIIALQSAQKSVPLVALETNLKNTYENARASAIESKEGDVDFQMTLAREFFKLLVVAPTLLNSALVHCHLKLQGEPTEIPLLVYLYRSTSFAMMLKSYVDYAKGSTAGVILIEGVALRSPQDLVLQHLVKPFDEFNTHSVPGAMIESCTSKIADNASNYFKRIIDVDDAFNSGKHIIELLFQTLISRETSQVMKRLWFSVWESAISAFAASSQLILHALRFSLKQLDVTHRENLEMALDLLQSICSQLVNLKPTTEDLDGFSHDGGVDLFLENVYTRVFDAAAVLDPCHPLRPQWIGIAICTLRALFSWRPSNSSTVLSRLPSEASLFLAVDVWYSLVVAGVTFTKYDVLLQIISCTVNAFIHLAKIDTNHTDVFAIARHKEKMKRLALFLVEQIVLNPAHKDHLMQLCGTQNVFQLGNFFEAAWASLKEPLRVALTFLQLTAASPSRAVIHLQVCQCAPYWLLGLPVDLGSTMPAGVSDSTMTVIAEMLCATHNVVSIFVMALIDLGTQRSLMWLSSIQEALCVKRPGGGPRNVLKDNCQELLIQSSGEAKLFRFMDDVQLRERAAAILRVLRGVCVAASENDERDEADEGRMDSKSAQLMFHESDALNVSTTTTTNVVATLAIASKRTPEAIAWLKDASLGWFGDTTIASQLQLQDLIPETSDLVLTLTTKKNISLIVQSVVDPTPILLVGESGTSKTYTVCQAATLLQKTNPQLTLLRINMHSQMTDEEFFGKYVSTKTASGGERLEFVLQPFARAYQDGHWILLDEVNLAPAMVFVRLESALSSDSIVVNKAVIRRHPDFRLFTTMNPDTGKWSDKRNKLSAQFVNIFRVVQLKTLPRAEWIEVLKHPKHLNDEVLAEKVVQFVERLLQDVPSHENGNYGEITIRELLRLSDSLKEVMKNTGESRQTVLPWVVWCVFGARYRLSSTRKAVEKAMSDCLGVNCSSNSTWIDRAIKAAVTKEVAAKSTDVDELDEKIKRYHLLRTTIEVKLVQEEFYHKYGLYVIPESFWLPAKEIHTLAKCDTFKGTRELEKRMHEAIGDILSMFGATDARKELLQAIRGVNKLAQLVPQNVACVDNPSLRRTPIVMTPSMLSYWRTLYVAMHLPFPLLISGSEGQGKASILLSLASVLRHKIGVYNLTPETESSELMGQYVASSDPDALTSRISWIDGKVTEAVRSGSILLLTNISSADSKLLERMNPVLERDPKLILQEHQIEASSGTISSIDAQDGLHTEAEDVTLSYQQQHGGQRSPFRIFSTLATSHHSAGTELSPALFNRFTIVHVEDTDKTTTLKTFASVLLKDHIDLQQELFVDDPHNHLVVCAPTMEALTRSNVSNRTLVRILKLMVAHVGLVDKSKTALKCAIATAWDVDAVQGEDSLIASLITVLGPLKPHRFENVNVSSQYVIPPKHYSRFDRVIACIRAGVPILLEGPPSTGKTELIRELSRVDNVNGSLNTLENVINSSSTTVNDYWGSHALNGNGSVVFCDGPLARALRNGYWLLVDELNLALPEVLNTLLAVLDGAMFATNPITQEQVKVNPQFRLFATQNPSTDHGRSHLPDTIVKRFASVQFLSFEVGELEQIIQHCFPCFRSKWAEAPLEIAKIMYESHGMVTMRHIRKWAKRVEHLQCVAGKTEKQFILDIGSSLLPVAVVDESVIFRRSHDQICKITVGKAGTATFQLNSVFATAAVSIENCDVSKREKDVDKWPTSFRKGLVELAFAMQCNEPVLLVGPPSFKSLLLRTWSQISGQTRLVSYLTRETEVADLIGSVKPVAQPQLVDELRKAVTFVESTVKDDEAKRLCNEFCEILSTLNSSVDDEMEALISSTSTEAFNPYGTTKLPPTTNLRNFNIDIVEDDEDLWDFGAEPEEEPKQELEYVDLHEMEGVEADQCAKKKLDDDDHDSTVKATAPPPETAEDIMLGEVEINPLCDLPAEEVENRRFERFQPLCAKSEVLVRLLREVQYRDHAVIGRILRLVKELSELDSDQPSFLFVDGPVLQATAEGMLMIFEDFDGATASTIERFNPLAEPDRRLDVPEDVQAAQLIPGKSSPLARKQCISPKFQLVGTAHSCDKLSPATLSRYTIIPVTMYTIEEMYKLLQPVFDKAWVPKECVELHKLLEQAAFQFSSSTRDLRRLERWAAFVCSGTSCETWRLRVVYGARVFYCEGIPRSQERDLLFTFCNNVPSTFLPKSTVEMLLGLKEFPMEVNKITDFFLYHPDPDIPRLVTTCGIDLPGEVHPKRVFEPTESFLRQLSRSAFTPSVVELFEKMFAVLGFQSSVDPNQAGRKCPLLLVGPPGRGKTKFAQFVAEMLGYQFKRFNFSGDTSREDVFGSIRPVAVDGKRSFSFQLGELSKAVESDHYVILLDELNLANIEVLDALAVCLDTSNLSLSIPESGKGPFPLDNIVFIAAINPPHIGGGRKPLPRSIANLFTRVELDAYTSAELCLIGGELLKPLSKPLDDCVGITSDMPSKILDCFTTVNQLIESKEVGGGQAEDRGLRDLTKIIEMIRKRSENRRQSTALRTTEEEDDDLDENCDIVRADSTSYEVQPGSPNHASSHTSGRVITTAVSKQLLMQFVMSVLSSSFREPTDRKRIDEKIASIFYGQEYKEWNTHLPQLRVTGSTVTVGTVTLARAPQCRINAALSESNLFVYTDKSLRDMESIMAPVSAQRPVLICGSLASAKTATVMEIARLCNRDILLIGGHSELDVSDIIGAIAPNPLNDVERIRLLATNVFDEILAHILSDPSRLTGESNIGAELSELDTLISAFPWSDALAHPDASKKNLESLLRLIRKILEASDLRGTEMFDVLRRKIDEAEKLRKEPWKPGFDFQQSAFVDAMLEGKWVLFDNVNAAPQNVVERLLPLLEDEPMLDLYESGKNMILRPRSHPESNPDHFIHPDFRLFFTADLDRADCPKPSAAFIDRLIVVHLDSEKLTQTSSAASQQSNVQQSGDDTYKNSEMFAILSRLWPSLVGVNDDAVALEITRFFDYAASCERKCTILDRLISSSRLTFRTALQAMRTAGSLISKFKIATHAALAIAISQTFVERAPTSLQGEMYETLLTRATNYWSTLELVNKPASSSRNKSLRTREEIAGVMKHIEELSAIVCGEQITLSKNESQLSLWYSARRMMSLVLGSCNNPVEASSSADMRATRLSILPGRRITSLIQYITKKDVGIFDKIHQLVCNASFMDCAERELLCRRVAYSASMCASALEPLVATAGEAREVLRALEKVALDSAMLLSTAEPLCAKRLFKDLESTQNLDRLRLELERRYWQLQIPDCGYRLRSLLKQDLETDQLQGYNKVRHVAQVYAACALAWGVAIKQAPVPETPTLLNVLSQCEIATIAKKCLHELSSCWNEQDDDKRHKAIFHVCERYRKLIDISSYRRLEVLRLMQFSLVRHRIVGNMDDEGLPISVNNPDVCRIVAQCLFDFMKNDLEFLGAKDTPRLQYVALAVLLQTLLVANKLVVPITVLDGRHAIEFRQAAARISTPIIVIVVVREGDIALLHVRPPLGGAEVRPRVSAVCFTPAQSKVATGVTLHPIDQDDVADVIEDLGLDAAPEVIASRTDDTINFVTNFFDAAVSYGDLQEAVDLVIEDFDSLSLKSRISQDGLLLSLENALVGNDRPDESLASHFDSIGLDLTNENKHLLEIFQRLSRTVAPRWSLESWGPHDEKTPLHEAIGRLCIQASKVLWCIVVHLFAEGGQLFQFSNSLTSLTELVAVADVLAAVIQNDCNAAANLPDVASRVRNAFHFVLPGHSLDFGSVNIGTLFDGLCTEVSTLVALSEELSGIPRTAAQEKALRMRRNIIQDLDRAKVMCDEYEPHLNHQADEIAKWKAKLADSALESWTDEDFIRFRNKMPDFGARLRDLVKQLKDTRPPRPVDQPDVSVLPAPASFGNAITPPSLQLDASMFNSCADSTFSTRTICDMATRVQEFRRRWNCVFANLSCNDESELELDVFAYRQRVLKDQQRFDAGFLTVKGLLVDTLSQARAVEAFTMKNELLNASSELRMWERTNAASDSSTQSLLPAMITPEPFLLADVALLSGATKNIILIVMQHEVAVQESLLSHGNHITARVRASDIPDFAPSILVVLEHFIKPSLHFHPLNRLIIASLAALAASTRLPKQHSSLGDSVKSLLVELLCLDCNKTAQMSEIAMAAAKTLEKASTLKNAPMSLSESKIRSFKETVNTLTVNAHLEDTKVPALATIRSFGVALPAMLQDCLVIQKAALTGIDHQQVEKGRSERLVNVKNAVSALNVNDPNPSPAELMESAKAQLLTEWCVHSPDSGHEEVLWQCDTFFTLTKLSALSSVVENRFTDQSRVLVERTRAAVESVGQSLGVHNIATHFGTNVSVASIHQALRCIQFIPQVYAAFDFDFSFAAVDTWSTAAASRLQTAIPLCAALRSATLTMRQLQHSQGMLELNTNEVSCLKSLLDHITTITKGVMVNVVAQKWSGITLQSSTLSVVAANFASALQQSRPNSSVAKAYGEDLKRHFVEIDQRLMDFFLEQKFCDVQLTCVNAEKLLAKSFLDKSSTSSSGSVPIDPETPIAAFLSENAAEYALPCECTVDSADRLTLKRPRTRLRLALFAIRKATQTLVKTRRHQMEVALWSILESLPALLTRPYKFDEPELDSQIQILLDIRLSVIPAMQQTIDYTLKDHRKKGYDDTLATLTKGCSTLTTLVTEWRQEQSSCLQFCTKNFQADQANAIEKFNSDRKSALDSLRAYWLSFLSFVRSREEALRVDKKLQNILQGVPNVSIPSIFEAATEEWILHGDSKYYDGERVFSSRPHTISLTNNVSVTFPEHDNRITVQTLISERTRSTKYFLVAKRESSGTVSITGYSLGTFKNKYFEQDDFFIVTEDGSPVQPIERVTYLNRISHKFTGALAHGGHTFQASLRKSEFQNSPDSFFSISLNLVLDKAPVPLEFMQDKKVEIPLELKWELTLRDSCWKNHHTKILNALDEKFLGNLADRVAKLFQQSEPMSANQKAETLKAALYNCAAVKAAELAKIHIADCIHRVTEVIELISQHQNFKHDLERALDSARIALEGFEAANISIGATICEKRLIPCRDRVKQLLESLFTTVRTFVQSCEESSLLIHLNRCLQIVKSPEFKLQTLNVDAVKTKLVVKQMMSSATREIHSDFMSFLVELKGFEVIGSGLASLDVPTGDVDHSNLMLLPQSGTLEISLMSVGDTLQLSGPHQVDFGSLAKDSQATKIFSLRSSVMGQKAVFEIEVENTAQASDGSCEFSSNIALLEIPPPPLLGEISSAQCVILCSPSAFGSFRANLVIRCSTAPPLTVVITASCVEPNLHALMLRGNALQRHPLVLVYALDTNLEDNLNVCVDPSLEVTPLIAMASVVRSSVTAFVPQIDTVGGVETLRVTIASGSTPIQRFIDVTKTSESYRSAHGLNGSSSHPLSQCVEISTKQPVKFEYVNSATRIFFSSNSREFRVRVDPQLLSIRSEDDSVTMTEALVCPNTESLRIEAACSTFLSILGSYQYGSYSALPTVSIPLVWTTHEPHTEAVSSVSQSLARLPHTMPIKCCLNSSYTNLDVSVLDVSPPMSIINLGCVDTQSKAVLRVQVNGRIPATLKVECSYPFITALYKYSVNDGFSETISNHGRMIYSSSCFVFPLINVPVGPFDFTVRLHGARVAFPIERRFVGFIKTDTFPADKRLELPVPTAVLNRCCRIDNLRRDESDMLASSMAWMFDRGPLTESSVVIGALGHLLHEHPCASWPAALSEQGTHYFSKSLSQVIEVGWRLRLPYDPSLRAPRVQDVLNAIVTSKNASALAEIERRLAFIDDTTGSTPLSMLHALHCNSIPRIQLFEHFSKSNSHSVPPFVDMAFLPADLSHALYAITFRRKKLTPIETLESWATLRCDSVLLQMVEQLKNVVLSKQVNVPVFLEGLLHEEISAKLSNLLTQSTTYNFLEFMRSISKELQLPADLLRRLSTEVHTLEASLRLARSYATPQTVPYTQRVRLELICNVLGRWNGSSSCDAIAILCVVVGLIRNMNAFFSLAHLSSVVLGISIDPTGGDSHDQIEDAIKQVLLAFGYDEEWMQEIRGAKTLDDFLIVFGPVLTDKEQTDLRNANDLLKGDVDWKSIVTVSTSIFSSLERSLVNNSNNSPQTIAEAFSRISEDILPRPISQAAASVSAWFEMVTVIVNGTSPSPTPCDAFRVFVGAICDVLAIEEVVVTINRTLNFSCNNGIRSKSDPPLLRGGASSQQTDQNATLTALQQFAVHLTAESSLEESVNALIKETSDAVECKPLSPLLIKPMQFDAEYDSCGARFVSCLYHRRVLVPFLANESNEVRQWVQKHPLSKLLQIGVRLIVANIWLMQSSNRSSSTYDIFEAFPELTKRRKALIDVLAHLQISEILELFNRLKIEFSLKPNEGCVIKRKVRTSVDRAAHTVQVDSNLIVDIAAAVKSVQVNNNHIVHQPKPIDASTLASTSGEGPQKSSEAKIVVDGKSINSSPTYVDPNATLGVVNETPDDSVISSLRTELQSGKIMSQKELEIMYDKIKSVAPPRKAEVHSIPIDAGKKCLSYAAVAQSSHVRRLVNQIARSFRDMLVQCRSHGANHQFRWVLFVDNSGSLKKYTSVMRLCVVVLMEVLRKLEVEFNVYGFWQKLSLLYEAKDKKTFDFEAGQRVLEGLVFEGGTSLLSCLHEALNRGFGPTAPNATTHNMLLMLSDCFTNERDISDVQDAVGATSTNASGASVGGISIADALRLRQVNMSCLSIGNKENQNVVKLLTTLTGRHGAATGTTETQEPCFTFATIDELEHEESLLPQRVTGLVSKQTELEFQAIAADAKPKLASSPTTTVEDIPVRVVPAQYVPALETQGGDSIPARLIRLLQTPIAVEHKNAVNRVATSNIHEGLYTFERDLHIVTPSNFRKVAADSKIKTIMEHVARRDPPPADARAIEVEVEKELYKVTTQCRAVLEDVFPFNRFTRKQPSRRGSTLSIKGLVRAIMSNFTDTRFFAAKTVGGVRDYNFVLAIDTSVSMRGPSFVNAVACTLAMAQALRDAGVERFSVIMYGGEIKIVKTPAMLWDTSCKAVLLSAQCDNYETNDVEMLRFCTEELLKEGRERHLFVFTDGFTSSSRKDLGEALYAAKTSNIEVTAVYCGFEDNGCRDSYGRYLTAQHPMQLSGGLKLLFSDAVPIKYSCEESEVQSPLDMSRLGEKDYDPLQLNDMLQCIRNATVHDAEIIEFGGGPGGNAAVVDVAFCLDLTASMRPFLENTIKSIIELATALSSCEEGSPLHGSVIRYGVSCFRDIGEDQGPMLDFLPPTDPSEVHLNALRKFLDLTVSGTRICCIGGGDIPEDVVGGMQRVTTLFEREGKSLSPTANRFVMLLSDAPAHGTEHHPDGMTLHDSFPNYPMDTGRPTLVEVLKQMNSLKIFLICGGIRPSLTKRFHFNILKEAPKRDGETMVLCGGATELFSDGVAQDRFHFIFALDVSGSMACGTGSTTRLGGLKEAFKKFMAARRKQQGQTSESDLISVTTHESSAHELVRLRNMSDNAQFDETVSKVLSISAGGGNDFNSGLLWCNNMVDATPSGYVPVVIFMADGGDCVYTNDKYTTVANIVALRPHKHRARLYSIMAYSTSPGDVQLMQTIANVAASHGATARYDGSPNPEELEKLFASIAGDSKPIDNLVKTVAGHVRDAITQAISSRCY